MSELRIKHPVGAVLGIGDLCDLLLYSDCFRRAFIERVVGDYREEVEEILNEFRNSEQ
jgi:hypothetical protein